MVVSNHLTTVPRARYFSGLLLGVLMLASVGSHARELGNRPLYYETLEKPLEIALQELSLLLDLSISGVDLPAKIVSGEFFADDSASFLDFFCETHGLDWIDLDSEILITDTNARITEDYAFPSEITALSFRQKIDRRYENRTKFPEKIINRGNNFYLEYEAPSIFHAQVNSMIDTKEVAVDEIVAAEERKLRDVNAVVELPKIVVTAPEIIVTTPVESTRISSSQVRTKEVTLGIMRFQLHHAWVTDKSLVSAGGGEPVFMPGVASIFEQLVKATRADALARTEQLSKLQALTPIAGDAIATPPASAEQRPAAAPLPLTGPGTTANLPNITTDSRTNALLIYDDLSYREFYSDLIRDLDRPLQIVELEAMVIDVSSTRMEELGIAWSAIKKGGKSSLGFNPGYTFGSTGRLGDIDLIVNSTDFIARLHALTQDGGSRIVSQPSILVMDNHQANIETESRFYVKVSGSNTAALYPVSTGTKLSVIPRVVDGPDVEHRRIQLLVSIRDGKVDNTAAAQIDGLPSITERNINTQAVVFHGESLLIGGHTLHEDSESSASVPGLSALPLIGLLFSKTTAVKKSFVRLFLIRPSLIEMSFERVATAQASIETEPVLSDPKQPLAPLPELPRSKSLRAAKRQQSIPRTKVQQQPIANGAPNKPQVRRPEVLEPTPTAKPSPPAASVQQALATPPPPSGQRPNGPEKIRVRPTTLLNQAQMTAGTDLPTDTAETVLLRIIMAGSSRISAELSPATSESGYLLQIGAFAQAGQARRLKQELDPLGLNGYVEQILDSEVVRVRVGTFSTLAEVQATRMTLAQHGIKHSLLIPPRPAAATANYPVSLLKNPSRNEPPPQL